MPFHYDILNLYSADKNQAKKNNVTIERVKDIFLQ